jgi:hypothetical protein
MKEKEESLSFFQQEIVQLHKLITDAGKLLPVIVPTFSD